MEKTQFDTIVIGGGSAGLAFAKTAADLGAQVLMLERAHLGGTCVNRGCVPKKILWAAGRLAKSTAQAGTQGIMATGPVDFQMLIEKRDAHIASLRDSFERKLGDAGVTLKRGHAVVMDRHKVAVEDTEYTAHQVVLATGGRPHVLDIDGADHLQDSDDVLSWDARPGRIAIIGGGYIGCEVAAIFAALGSEVTLVHDGTHVLDTHPEALALHVQESLRLVGVQVCLNDRIVALAPKDDALCYTLETGETRAADAVVAATGRAPNIHDLGPLVAGLETADSGVLAISDGFETSCEGIYAIGDVSDRLPLTPVASADGTVLAHKLHGDGAPAIDLDRVATTTFVYPPAAYVGDMEGDVLCEGTVAPLEDSVLTNGAGAPDFYQIWTKAGSDHLSGVALAAHGAEDMIAVAGALIAANARVEAFVQATAVHPSFAEEFFFDTRKDA